MRKSGLYLFIYKVKILTKHFLLRFVNNDAVKFANEKKEAWVSVLAVFFIANFFFIESILTKYLFMPKSLIKMDYFWVDISLCFTLTMGIIGIIAIFVWDNIYLDEIDLLNLFHLPVSRYVIFFSKAFSIIILCILISITLNLLSTLAFATYIADIFDISFFKYLAVHFFAAFCSSLFVFLIVATLQSLLKVFFNGELLRIASNIIKILLLIGFIIMIVELPLLIKSLEQLKNQNSKLLLYFPFLWFSGLHQYLLSRIEPVFSIQTTYAINGLILLLLVYIGSLPIGIKKILNITQNNKTKVKKNHLKKIIYNYFLQFILKSGIQRAIYYFISNTFKKEIKLKFKLIFILAFPVVLIVSEIILQYWENGWVYFNDFKSILVIIPGIIFLFLIIGLRFIFSTSVNLDANWIFKIALNNNDIKHANSAIKKFVFFKFVLPFSLVFILFYYLCWGFKFALFHTLFGISIALIIMEITFYSFRKIPFTTEPIPGKINLKTLWVVYIFFLSLYSISFINLGRFLLNNPIYYVPFHFIVLIFIFTLRYTQLRKSKDIKTFDFDEDAKPYFIDFSITE